MRKIIVALFALLAVTATGYAVEPLVTSDTAGASATGDTVCQMATATTPGYTQAAHTIADNGTGVYTIPGKEQGDVTATAQACVTVPAPATTTATTSTTTTSPSPPTGKPSIRGPILFRYGTSWASSPSSGYDRYGVVVVGYGDDVNAAALQNAKALTYKAMAEVFSCASSDTCLSGVSIADAQAAGGLLANSGGQLLSGTYGGTTYNIGDIGSTAYQNLWVQKVEARLDSKGLDGVFVDNVLCDFADELSGNGPAAKYPTAASERAAALSFVKNVSTQLQADGKYVLTNTFCWGDGSAASNTAWWSDVAPYPNGMITETFEQNPSGANYYDLRYDCPSCSWMGDWKARLDVIAAVGSADAWELTSAVDASSVVGKAVAKYGCASLLLKWNGTGGGCGVNTGGSDPYDASGWAYPIGTPTGTMTQSGGAFYRTYTGGRVIVNPSLSTQTVLGVTLPAKSAYIGV